MSIGPGIKSVGNQGSEKHCITPVVCHGHQSVPQNPTSALATDIFPILSLYLRMNNVLSTVERNMVEGKAWPCLYFLNFHAINELMTFPKFLEKSCYQNSFLLSFQANLLLFIFFWQYINFWDFIHLIMTHHCLCSMDKRGGLHSWKLNGWLWVTKWEVS